jgi:preprotein translocase SecF subunit
MFGASMAGTIYSLGYTLMVGIITNFIFGIFCSRLMLESLSKFKFFKKRKFFGVKDVVDATPLLERKRYKITNKRKVFYSISSALVAVFIILTVLGIPKIAIEFKGGSLISYTYDGDIDTSAVEDVVKDVTGETCIVTTGEDYTSGKTTLQLSFSSKDGISDDNQTALKESLNENFADNNIETLESTNVSATNGKTFFGKCLVALLIAVVVMILYIGIRFRNIGGVSAGAFSVVALLHDMAMVYGAFIIFGFDINSNFIAVLLTIMGYSINSTIIIYDRIRENKRLYGKRLDIQELTNMSITQTIARNIHTNVTTVSVMIIVCVVCSLRGVTSIISFALPLIIGMLSGVYTSMCLAPSLWVHWQQHKAKKNPTKTVTTSKKKKKKKSGYKDTGYGYGAQV